MIRFVSGNIFDAQVDAIVNTVNLMGVMGKGIALQFKERFSNNFVIYLLLISLRRSTGVTRHNMYLLKKDLTTWLRLFANMV